MIDTLWPHQSYALAEVPRRVGAGERKICVTSPTGGGKSRIMCGLIDWAVQDLGWPVIVYTNRRLLIEQLARVMQAHGISFGVRAAGHETDMSQQVQVSSLPSENSRTLKAGSWLLHGLGEPTLALVDEAHLNSSGTAQKILARHIEDGGAYVGLTATPIDLAHLYDTLVVAGNMSQLRECGALVPCRHYGPDEPDMKNFKQNVKTGEYSEGDVRKAIMTKRIFGRVLEHYGRYNPDGRPTILFGPGVAESIWFAEQLTAAGVRAAHIDGGGVWLDGEYQRNADRDYVLKAVRNGDIKVLCNRFVLREGLDLPEVSHLILATVMGSLRTFLQSVGRGLRKCEGKDRLTLQDHGGHWHRHGSVNVDREWNLAHTETVVRGLREEALRDKRQPEPIHCPKCGLIRKAGPKCPDCGHECRQKVRMVMQADGALKEYHGDVYALRRIREYPNTRQIWTRTYYRAKNSRNRMTFRQAEGLFFYENHYYPPRTLPFMPASEMDWFMPVADVPPERLMR